MPHSNKSKQTHQTAMIIGVIAILAGIGMTIYSRSLENNGITVLLGIVLLGTGWLNDRKPENGD